MNSNSSKDARITTACLLAAGTGSRLYPLTDSVPKCLTEVNGVPILRRLVDNLSQQGFKRLVIVVGHFENQIREFLGHYDCGLNVDYITNPLFKTTNNIYSLWLVRDTIKEPFLLVESDLIFDSQMITELLHPDKIAVSRILPWMKGTTITMKSSRRLSAFCLDGIADIKSSSYKTVNICSLSAASWRKVFDRLDQYIADGRVNDYYEVIFKEMVTEGSLSFECVLFDAKRWYEIDSMADLNEAEHIHWPINNNQSLFPNGPETDIPPSRIYHSSDSRAVTVRNTTRKQ
ncbi:MAG: phosphocholine cytidylyltransferase family protein [Candidatus Lindowbacteria bacterium]|nr:phosphocholine cytidylyltransferase family protein [Candidatus Lindowbacteria bacterium]